MSNDIVAWVNKWRDSKDIDSIVPNKVVRSLIDLAYEKCERKQVRTRTWFWYKADGYECGDPKNDETEWEIIICVNKDICANIKYYSCREPTYGYLDVKYQGVSIGTLQIDFIAVYINPEYAKKISDLMQTFD